MRLGLALRTAALPVHARPHVHLAARFGQLHLALALREAGFLFRAALVVAMGTAHALDVVG